jgi:hypothetical protein
MLFLTLLYYYLGPARVITSIYYFFYFPKFIFLKNISIAEILSIIYLFVFVIVKYIQTGDIIASFLFLRLYWGFFAFYFFFRIKPYKNYKNFFVFCAYLTILEFILIRLIPNLTSILPNYDGTFNNMIESYGILGGVHSFGGNRSVTGVLLLSAYVFFDQNKDEFKASDKYLILCSSLITFSATCWLLFFAYLLIKRANKLIFPFILALVLGVFIYVSSIWGRISLEYIVAVYDIKEIEIGENLKYLNENNLSYFFGTSYVESNSAEIKGYGNLVGDFSYLDFYLRNGVLGVVIFLFILLSNFRRENSPMLLILVAGTFHYHVIFSFPGQVIFAFFLMLEKPKEKLNKFQFANSTS